MFDTTDGIADSIRDERHALRERTMDWRQRRLQQKVTSLHQELEREQDARRALADAIGNTGRGSKKRYGLLRLLLIGGGAYILGPAEESLAVINASYSYVTDTPDFWRREYQRYPEHGQRFTGEPAYFKHVLGAAKGMMERAGFQFGRVSPPFESGDHLPELFAPVPEMIEPPHSVPPALKDPAKGVPDDGRAQVADVKGLGDIRG